jgi:hypothetical protein
MRDLFKLVFGILFILSISVLAQGQLVSHGDCVEMPRY